MSFPGSLWQLKPTSRQIVSSPHTITSSSFPSPRPTSPYSRVFLSPLLPLPLCCTTLISSHETSLWNVVRWLRLTRCHFIPNSLYLSILQLPVITLLVTSPLCSFSRSIKKTLPNSKESKTSWRFRIDNEMSPSHRWRLQ